MKKKLSLLVLTIFAMLTAALSVAAAEYYTSYNLGDSASMEIAYQLTENEVMSPSGPPGSDEQSETYTVIIPSTINLKEQQDFAIRAEDVSIPAGKSVVVYIDGARTFAEDGNFYIYNGGTDTNRRMKCDVLRGLGESSIQEAELLRGSGDFIVATFGNNDFISQAYGRVFVSPSYNLQNIPGDYSGAIYFKICIEND